MIQCIKSLSLLSLARIFRKLWKRHYSVFARHLSPTVLRAASQAALQRENLTSAWACEIFGLALTTALPYRIGSRTGRGPSGKASSIWATSASVRSRSAARAFSAMCSRLEALGIAKSEGCRTRNRSATWRMVALCAAAIRFSTRPPVVRGPGKSPWPKGL